MDETGQRIRAAQAETLTTAASSIESALVGLLSTLLSDEALDDELEEVKHLIRVEAHHLRKIASKLVQQR